MGSLRRTITTDEPNADPPTDVGSLTTDEPNADPPDEWKKKNNDALLKTANECRRLRCTTQCPHRIPFITGKNIIKSNGKPQWHWYARAPPHGLATVGEWRAEATKPGGGKLGSSKFQRLEGDSDEKVVSGTKSEVYNVDAHVTRGRTRLIREELMLSKGRVIAKSKHLQGVKHGADFLGLTSV
jgi:hypothetical protein